jgi:hypothetical protein
MSMPFTFYFLCSTFTLFKDFWPALYIHSFTHKHAQMRTRTNAHTHTHARAYTHTHTYMTWVLCRDQFCLEAFTIDDQAYAFKYKTKHFTFLQHISVMQICMQLVTFYSYLHQQPSEPSILLSFFAQRIQPKTILS